MEQPQETAATYYNIHRKRSLLYSRAVVMTSMIVLVVALGINVALLSSQDKQTTNTHAATSSNPHGVLPSLPTGCLYEKVKSKLTITCPTIAPTDIAQIPIHIVLPQLPPQCSFSTSSTGNEIICTATHDPIPTIPVELPINCTASGSATSVPCVNSANHKITVALPILPRGCIYQIGRGTLFVVCQTR